MRAVNLLPRDETQGGKRPPLPVLIGCAGAVLAAAVLALMYVSASSQVGQQRTALVSAQAAYAAIPSPAPPPAVDGQLPQQHQNRVSALATALGQRLPWDRLLREVSQVVPSDVWLTSLNVVSPTITAPTTAAGVLPQEFVVNGCTYSQDSVARFLARLDVVPDLTRVTLGKSLSGESAGSPGSDSTSVSGACPTGMVSFTLNGDLHTGTSS